MPWGYAAAAIGGALISSDSTRSASNKQTDATNRATDLQKYIFDQQQKNQQPYLDTGYGALGKLSDLLGISGKTDAEGYGSLLKSFQPGDLSKDAGYQFRLQQGQNALENSAAARGGLFSGAAGKALDEYGQGFASNEFSNAYNRFNTDRNAILNPLQSLAGLGQTATQQVGNAGQNYANQAGANMIGAGNAQAAASLAQGNIWGNVFNQGASRMGGSSPFGSYTSPNMFGNYSNPYGETGGYAGATMPDSLRGGGGYFGDWGP